MPTDDTGASVMRCPLCSGRAWQQENGRLRCGYCGLQLHRPIAERHRLCESLRTLLRPGHVDTARCQAMHMDAYTLRSAASAAALGYEPDSLAQDEALHHPHVDLAASGHLRPFARMAARITLGILTSKTQVGAARQLIARFRTHFADTLVLVDADSCASVAQQPGIRYRPLDDDFAAQRNTIQAAASTAWVLQLDTDEVPDRGLLDTMDALTEQADRQGIRSIGLPRYNRVDDSLSDLYPDIQYRLNHRDVRYSGRVHERPDLDGRWELSMIAPGATLTHRLQRLRVLERSMRYESVEPGAGRPSDEAALLRSFTPGDDASTLR